MNRLQHPSIRRALKWTSYWILTGAMFVSLAGVSSCPPSNSRPVVEITPLTLKVVEKQSGFLTRDKPYFAIIKFSSRFNTPGSTQVEFIEPKVDLGRVREGDTVDFPAFIGDPPRSLQDELNFGVRIIPTDPEGFPVSIDGVMVAGMEDDVFGWRAGVADAFRDTADCLESALIEHVETATWSTVAFASALNGVKTKLKTGCERDESLDGRLAVLLGDDPMGTAFIVRLGVTRAYYNANLAPLLSLGGEGTPDEAGCGERIYAGCAPFLANPCAMRDQGDAFTQYSSICAAEGSRYPQQLTFPYESNRGGKWSTTFGF